MLRKGIGIVRFQEWRFLPQFEWYRGQSELFGTRLKAQLWDGCLFIRPSCKRRKKVNLINYKRLTLVCGHYGSGKTNAAINFALDLKKTVEKTAIADLDIVNPYFRTKDSKELLYNAGIKLICSEYAGSNVDIPALPQEMYSITDDKTQSVILDIGGDDRGALALGRLAPQILSENDYEMLMVVNCYRPLTRDVSSALEVMREIEFAGGIPFTGIVNNSNLGEETAAEDVLSSLPYAEELSRISGLPVKCTTVYNKLYKELEGKANGIFPIKLQPKII